MNYKKRPLWQWIVLYLIIGAIIYALIYFIFIKGIYKGNSNSGGSTSYSTQAKPTSQQTQSTNQDQTYSQTPANGNASSQATNNSTGQSSSSNSNQSQTSESKSFTVSADDNGADLENISVAKGTMVSLTFKVKTGTTYHGGLEFVGGGIDTGTITPGSSKTVQFTADKSFSFVPYWPANSVKKDYTIDIAIN